MSQSKTAKTSPVEEKTFVVRQVFTNANGMTRGSNSLGDTQKHFNLPWRIRLVKEYGGYQVFLDCSKEDYKNKWSLETDVEFKIVKTVGGPICFSLTHKFEWGDNSALVKEIEKNSELEMYLVDGNLTVECHVKIKRTIGIQLEPMRKFDESMEEFSDVVLIVQNKKFYVNKMYLATHSTYFRTLFLGNFKESGKAEIELKDIEPEIFQSFLEVIYGEPAIDENSYEEILKLADMYESQTVTRRCEEFIILKSIGTLKNNFELAIKYGMDKLKVKCISEMKSGSVFRSIIPEDSTQIDHETWKQLLLKCSSFY